MGNTASPADEKRDMREIEWLNALSQITFARRKETPAKTWWDCDVWHPAIGRALRIDRTDEGAVFALAPFRLWHNGERHLILAAHPAPRILGPIDDDWLVIEDVIVWDPISDRAHLLDGDGDRLVGRFADVECGTVFASAREFFTAWCIERAQYFAKWVQSRQGTWAHPTPERDLAPGKLAIGDVSKIRWSGLPATVHARGIDPRNLNAAILRQANLPRAFAQEQRFAS